ncbi:unnamed protein product, partial [Brugia timori]|uniref:Secreted protein n=1 Tax=Brugia timori TaxID=42155 RepID=A0A0R3QF76_9BILA
CTTVRFNSLFPSYFSKLEAIVALDEPSISKPTFSHFSKISRSIFIFGGGCRRKSAVFGKDNSIFRATAIFASNMNSSTRKLASLRSLRQRPLGIPDVSSSVKFNFGISKLIDPFSNRFFLKMTAILFRRSTASFTSSDFLPLKIFGNSDDTKSFSG